jgi:arylformamidase
VSGLSAWIDSSIPIRSGMPVWPGDREVLLQRVEALAEGGACNLTECHFCAHTGTHVDAPLHYLEHGAAIDSLAPGALIGTARVVQLDCSGAVQPGMLPCDLQPGQRLLLRTSNSPRCTRAAEFHPDYVHLAPAAAQRLAEARVAVVGIDAPSVGGFENGLAETHRILLGAGIWIIENLDLTGVAAGHYEMICLPLPLAGADGAPARALLRRS